MWYAGYLLQYEESLFHGCGIFSCLHNGMGHLLVMVRRIFVVACEIFVEVRRILIVAWEIFKLWHGGQCEFFLVEACRIC